MKRFIVVVLLLFLVACQVSHKPVLMVNPATGEEKIVHHYGTTGRLTSALIAREAHEQEVDLLKKAGYKEKK